VAALTTAKGAQFALDRGVERVRGARDGRCFRQRRIQRQVVTVVHHRVVAGAQTAQVVLKSRPMIQVHDHRHGRLLRQRADQERQRADIIPESRVRQVARIGLDDDRRALDNGGLDYSLRHLQVADIEGGHGKGLPVDFPVELTWIL
jgi:hypothetical protein